MQLINPEVLQAAVSAAATVTTRAYDLGDRQNYFVHCDFSAGAGDLAGTFTLECASNSLTVASLDWVTVAGSSTAITSSASHVYNVNGAQYRFFRVVYTASSGTGNLTVYVTVKDSVTKGT